jgi:hypothetical protein
MTVDQQGAACHLNREGSRLPLWWQHCAVSAAPCIYHLITTIFVSDGATYNYINFTTPTVHAFCYYLRKCCTLALCYISITQLPLWQQRQLQLLTLNTSAGNEIHFNSQGPCNPTNAQLNANPSIPRM